jgi:hypothetical protein
MPARDSLEDLDLFASFAILDEVADVDGPVVAGEAFFSGWVRGSYACGRVLGVHRYLLLGRAPGCGCTCGAVLLTTLVII